MKRPLLFRLVSAALAQIAYDVVCRMHKIANNASGTLSAGIGTGDLTISLTAGHGARFPATSAEHFFMATLIDNAGNIEIIKVTTRATDTLTVERAQDGTTAKTFSAGDRIESRPHNAAILYAMQEAIQAVAGAGTDTYTGTLSPAPKAWNTDQVYAVKMPNANTSATPTLNLNSFGAKTIKRPGGVALVAGDIRAAMTCLLHYDGTDLILLNPAADVMPASVAATGVLSPAQITANQNDYNPTNLSTAAVLRLNTDARRSITGLAGGASGRMMVIHNVGSFAFTLVDESASSTAGNRFALQHDLELGPDESITLIYDGTTSRWRTKHMQRRAPTRQVFTSNGTYTKPAGVVAADIEVMGSGGAGGGHSTAGGTGDGGNGGAGGYARKLVAGTAIGATETVTVPAGGTGVLSGNGNNGATTSFGAHVSATGGNGGAVNAGGGAANGASGSGGSGSSGDINVPGQPGQLFAGSDVDNRGGDTMWGVGGNHGQTPSGSNGSAGSGFGAGGGGAAGDGSSERTGGNGAPGLCVVTEYY